MRQPDRAYRTRSRIEYGLLLLVSPFLVSLVASIAVAVGTGSRPWPWLWTLLAVSGVVWVAFFLAAFTPLFRKPILWSATLRRRRRFSRPHVAVLDGRISDDGTALVPLIYTVRTPDEWCQELRRQNPSWRIDLRSVNDALSIGADIVVNPFGEAYPEEDLSLHTTFIRIREYVRGGGVYVNVAGYPFWWKANPATGVKAEAGRWEQHPPNLMVLKSLLPDLLGISPVIPGSPQVCVTRQEPLDVERFGEIAGAGGGNDARIFRQYPATTQRMIPLLRNASGAEIVIGAMPYGVGHFVFAALEVDVASRSFAKGLAAVQGWAKYERDGRH